MIKWVIFAYFKSKMQKFRELGYDEYKEKNECK